MKIHLEPDDLDVRIELIPLIDVIFCILVFFILGAVSFGRAQGLNLDLPTAENAQTQLSDTLNVEIDALGQLKVEKATVTEAQLVRILGDYVRQKPQGVVVLQAEKLVSYGQVARLIDTLQKVGGNRVALGAVKPPTTQPNSPATDLLPDPLQLNPSSEIAPQVLPQPTVLQSPTLPSSATPLQQTGVPSAPGTTAPLKTAPQQTAPLRTTPSTGVPSPTQTR